MTGAVPGAGIAAIRLFLQPRRREVGVEIGAARVFGDLGGGAAANIVVAEAEDVGHGAIEGLEGGVRHGPLLGVVRLGDVARVGDHDDVELFLLFLDPLRLPEEGVTEVLIATLLHGRGVGVVLGVGQYDDGERLGGRGMQRGAALTEHSGDGEGQYPSDGVAFHGGLSFALLLIGANEALVFWG